MKFTIFTAFTFGMVIASALWAMKEEDREDSNVVHPSGHPSYHSQPSQPIDHSHSDYPSYHSHS